MPMKVLSASTLFRRLTRSRGVWLFVCLATACTDGDVVGVDRGTDMTGGANPAGNPLAGAGLYVDPSNHAAQTALAWRTTRPADAALMERVGRAPQAVWFGGWNADITTAVASVASTANDLGQLPVLVAYNIPQRDCGQYSAGGVNSADAYRAWIRGLADGLVGRKAVVILEPDALAGMDCLDANDRATRTSLLADAINVLKGNLQTYVYLDAGHARWHAASAIAQRLTAANIARADGFSLNVSNFIATDESVSYGASVSALIGGKHFVIDTSRNGQGSNGEWCNPAGRGLGIMPTTSTGHTLADALLWIKRPGESDGTCNGGPTAGAWWADYALGLAVRATPATMIASN